MGTSLRVRILGREVLARFTRRHAPARKPLQHWEQLVGFASWKSFVDLKKTFGSADHIGGAVVVFDIGGNKYRPVTMVDYARRIVLVTKVLTHAEYDKKGI
jgi:mRNA interferase HigB